MPAATCAGPSPRPSVEVFDILEWYQLRRGEAMVGVDLPHEFASLSEIKGEVTLRIGDRSRRVRVLHVEPPMIEHLPPYKRGERIALHVEFEETPDGPSLGFVSDRSEGAPV